MFDSVLESSYAIPNKERISYILAEQLSNIVQSSGVNAL